MGWTFVWLMVALKVPIAALLYLVWWAIHQTDDEGPDTDGSDDGGIRPPHRPGRRGPFPRRRGPHGDPALMPPVPRTRPPVHARAKQAARH
jgi:hypothetical protein